MKSTHGRSLRVLEACLWLVGIFCVVVLLMRWTDARGAEAAAKKITPQAIAPGGAAGGEGRAAAVRADAVKLPNATVIGRLEIPGVHLSVPVINDYDAAALLRGVGRIRGTAEPGGLGNFVVAGHRDTFFRPLRKITRGMSMNVVTPEGVYHYKVDRTEIVTPNEVDVLDIGSVPEMTLITCYPFYYIGAAPKRFVVHAHLLSLEPSGHS